MNTAAPRLDRLLRSVHRRGTLIYLLERAGAGLAVGAALAVLATLLRWNEASPVLLVSTLAIAGGTFVGLAWGVWQRPSMLRSAMLVDQQLATDDLLATAASLGAATTHDDPWASAVLAMAERRSAALSPSAVVVRRFTGRAWGGIGLAFAVAITTALLADVHASTPAEPAGAESSTMHGRQRELAGPLVAIAPEGPLLLPRGGAGVDENRSADAAAQAAGRPPDPSATRPTSPTDPAHAADATTSGSANDGSGVGMSTAKPPTPPAETVRPTAIGSAATQPAGTATRPAGGAGRPATTSAAGDDRGPLGGAGNSQSEVPPAPPWQSRQWDERTRDVRQQLRSGQVPAGYGDLVREYFEIE